MHAALKVPEPRNAKGVVGKRLLAASGSRTVRIERSETGARKRLMAAGSSRLSTTERSENADVFLQRKTEQSELCSDVEEPNSLDTALP